MLADELRTTPDFIEGMKRRGERTEFAVWVKNLTGRAIRLSCPLGFLERQPTLDVQEFSQLVAANRSKYSGTPQKMLWLPAPAPQVSRLPSQLETPFERARAVPQVREETPVTPPKP